MAQTPAQRPDEGYQAYAQRLTNLGFEVSGIEGGFSHGRAGETPTQSQSAPLMPGKIYTPPVIDSAVLTPATDLAKQVTTPAINPTYDISKLGGFGMTTEEASGGESGIKAYQERTAKLYAPDTGYTKTPEETKVQSLNERLQSLNEQLMGQSAFKAGQEVSQDIVGKQKAINDLTAQLRTLQNEAQTIPLQQAGVNVTSAMLGAKQRELLTQNSIKALGISAFLAAAQDNLALANDLVDKAVAAKFDPIKEEIAAKTANYDLIIKSPDATLAEQKRAQALKDIETAKESQVDTDELNTKRIYDIGLEAAKNGADSLTLQKIQNAATPEEALQIAANAGIYKEQVKATPPPKLTADDKAILYDQIKTRAEQLFADGATPEEYQLMKDEIISYGLGGYIDDFDKFAKIQLPQEPEKQFSLEEIKSEIVKVLTPQKDIYTRAESKTAAENQLMASLGLKSGQALPQSYKDIIEDALVEVYGKTFWQKVLPGGR